MTFVQATNSATVYWTKNSPVKPTITEQRYIEELLHDFESQKHVDDILKTCVEQCRPKIVSTCVKAGKQFYISPEGTNIARLGRTNPNHERLHHLLQSANAVHSPATLVEALDWFLRSLSEVNENTDLLHLCQLVSYADLVAPDEIPWQEHKFPIFHPGERRRIQRVGAYMGIIKHVLTICRKNRIKNLRQVQIPSPGQRQIQVCTFARAPTTPLTLYSHIYLMVTHLSILNSTQNAFRKAQPKERMSRARPRR